MRFPEPSTPQERLYIWRLGFPLVRALALFLAPMRTVDLENVPARGPYILLGNHLNWKDPLWLAFAVRRPVRYMAKEELFRWPFLGGVLRVIACFPVRRGQNDRRAYVTSLRVLEAKQVLGFFPEGHRSESGALIKAHPGIAGIALRSGAPIVPVAITGTKGSRLGLFWRRDITMRFGKPFLASELGENESQDLADAMMKRVASMLPSHMRGIYA